MTSCDPFHAYVAGFEQLLAQGRLLGAGQARAAALPAVPDGAPVCLVFSPHPDDEAIAGGLPLRLRREGPWRVVNVAVTLGSNRARRRARWDELRQCCDLLGFDLVSASGESEHGLERIDPMSAQADAVHWARCVERVAALLRLHRPQLVVCPHAQDGHPAHVGTHALVMDALPVAGLQHRLHLACSEYWNTQLHPGLMVELGCREVADLVAALSQHVGEVARNPYHVGLPAWFIDGVRRGAERVGAAGAAAPDFRFAALYGWQRWEQGALVAMPPRAVPLTTPAQTLFA
ncbi:MAG: PIG-L family deacetylase [Burkholderiaceae bacterium]|nr:PIG-L family deacetylase [Rhodoferax sp.]MCP5260421.1 PIG-L family deacetylase [Rhodoferax sp.]